MSHSKLRAKFSAEEIDNHWAISYGDMITLLLGFFVLFFNIKTDTVSLSLVKKDLDKYFKAKDGSVDRGVARADNAGGKTASPLFSTDITNALKIKTNLEGERVLVEFPEVSFFDSGTHHLTRAGKAALVDFSKAVIPHLGVFRLVVRGYTDGRAMQSRAKYKDNLELSAFRSIAAIRHLSDQGIALENMRIAGYGESHMSREDKKEGRTELQRKVVIVIEPLDHTERIPEVKKEGLPSAAKPIEEVSSVVVPQREPASKKHGLAESLNHGVSWVYQKGQSVMRETQFIISRSLMSVQVHVEGWSIYRIFLDKSVEKKLEDQGYSPAEAKEIIKSYNKKKKGVNK